MKATVKAQVKAKALLAQMVKETLVQIQAHQIKTLNQAINSKDSDPEQVNLVEVDLPFHWSETTSNCHLKIGYREQGASAGKETSEPIRLWQFDLTLELPDQQVMTARCTLSEEHCRIQFWADSQKLQQTIETKMAELKQALASDGITMDYGGCALGLAPTPAKSQQYAPLVDTTI